MTPGRRSLQRALWSRPQRFRNLRWLLSWLSVLLLAAVPLSGLGRLDLVGGDHLALGKPAGPGRALGVLFLAGGASYLVTFLVNFLGGRLFCGFGCPLSLITRLEEAVQTARPGSGQRRRRRALQGLYAASFAAALLLWWVAPAALPRASRAAQLLVALALAATTGAVLLHGRFWGWRFCTAWCPVGLYYSVVAPTKSFGIRFRAASCIECSACDKVCPVHLPPRELLGPVEREGGLSVSGVPAMNHCLSCGDCVDACELVMSKHPGPPVPLAFAWNPFQEQEAAHQEVG